MEEHLPKITCGVDPGPSMGSSHNITVGKELDMDIPAELRYSIEHEWVRIDESG